MKTSLLVGLTLAVCLRVSADPAPSDGYVAHEWGTFTSVQGADGIQLEWNPLTISELPRFVYDRNRGANGRTIFASKTAMATLQRMETPVIYFYSDQERIVDVTVNFPQGIVTEWFPQVRQAPRTAGRADPLIGPAVARWDGVRLLPAASHRAVSDGLPRDPSGSHYYSARGTDADFLQLTTASGKIETEKFLFYRGVGGFRAPLTVTLSGGDNESLTLENTGAEELRNLFVYQVKDGQGQFQFVERLTPKAKKSLRLKSASGEAAGLPALDNSARRRSGLMPLSELRRQIAQQVAEALVREGLYPREAEAMVKTWDDSWFAETGVRVLYTLPRAWTDRILPLTLDPAPREIVRVMVGRAELITPEMEWALLKEVARYCDSETGSRERAIENVRQLGLGRFAEPAMRRLMSAAPRTREFSTLSWELLQAASRPTPAGKGVARN